MATRQPFAPERQFIDELIALQRKYNVEIGGCGCCGSPFLTCEDGGKADLSYDHEGVLRIEGNVVRLPEKLTKPSDMTIITKIDGVAEGTIEVRGDGSGGSPQPSCEEEP